MKSIRSYLKKIISVLLLFLSGLLVAVYLYIGKAFKDASFEQLIYSLLHADGTSFDAIWEGLLYGSIILIVFSIIIYFPFYVNSKTSNYIHLKIGKIKKNIQIWPLSWKYLFIYSIALAGNYWSGSRLSVTSACPVFFRKCFLCRAVRQLPPQRQAHSR